MKWIDLPQLWLIGFGVLAWIQARFYTLGLTFGGRWADFVGGLLIGGGILLMLLAVSEFRRHRTTMIPHHTPVALIQSGVFSRTRNPIYLGDVLVLAGAILWFDAVLSLPLIPLFVWVLERRFILPEEDRMRRAFRMDWARYEHQTRRWV